MPDFVIEDQYEGIISGVDEVGVGPWAGPVVAAAVILDRNNFHPDINDSKKLTKEKREMIYDHLVKASDFGISIISEAIVDNINILEARKLAMKNALLNLKNKPHVALVDGNQKITVTGVKTVSIIKGDSKSFSIAAASIIAKVTRDRIMEKLHLEFPHYKWCSNVGYGTADHIKAIEQFGICKYHRKSYAPIKKYIEKNIWLEEKTG